MQSFAARSRAASDTVTDANRSRADVIFLRSFVSSFAHFADERNSVALEIVAAAHDFDAAGKVGRRPDFD